MCRSVITSQCASDWVLFIELQLLRNEKGINESELFRVVIISSIGYNCILLLQTRIQFLNKSPATFNK